MHAAILSIGDELAIGQSLDTNSRWLAARLAEAALMVIEHRTVTDDAEAIVAAVSELASRVHLLIVTGGLGPTADDLTREALRRALTPGEALVTDDDGLAALDKWFAKRGRTMPEANRAQARRPRTMRLIPNPHGTAPGLAGAMGECQIFALPGPPREMRPMFETHVLPALGELNRASALLTATVNEFGLGESDAAARLGEMMNRDRHPLVGTTASESIVSARLRAYGPACEMRVLLDHDIAEVERCWQPYAFSRGDETLQEVVGALLSERGHTLATAESCTGGWLSKRIVDVAGSSAYYFGGWVTYSNEMKTRCLGVDAALLNRAGAVSDEVAIAMARGAKRDAHSDFAIAVTGIAGPHGGTDDKPIGTVFIALAGPGDAPVTARRFAFTGDRTTIRDRSVKAAFQMLRFALLGVDERIPLLWEVGAGQVAGVGG